MTRLLKLSRGMAIVDDEDYEFLSQWKWSYAIGYAKRLEQSNGKRTLITMANAIMKLPPGQIVDHINGNTLDNRRVNLRPCSVAQNKQNCKRRRDNRSGFIGVRWHKKLGKFAARVRHLGKEYHLGVFTNAAEGARAYDAKAKELFGEFASLNFPDGD